MKFISKLLILMLLFVILLPSAQSGFVFQDIKEINEGMQEANDKLETIKKDISDLLETINETNEIMDEVQQNVALLEETNEEIKDMSEKLDEISNKATTALDLADKVDGYFGSLIIVLLVGISILTIAVFSLIAATILILKRRK